MKISHISSLVFFYLLLVSVSADVVQESCDKAAKGDPNINFDFCVSSFEENPKAKNATTISDLVPVSIETAISNATSIISVISKLLVNKSLEPYAKNCLQSCSELYSDAGSSLQTGGEAFEGKDYETANVQISAALDAPDNCEDQFKEKKGLVSPLTKENNLFLQLTAITLSFINMVKN